MRPLIQNQPQIDALSAPLGQSLRNLAASIQTGWNKQHNGDGTHAEITATSAAVSGLTTLGKIRLDAVIYNDSSAGVVHNITTPGLSDVSWLRIFPGQSLGADLEITGINATGRDTGDLLLVTNCDSGSGTGNDIILDIEDVRSTAANRFAANLTNAPASPFRLQTSRGVWLIYDYDVVSFGGARVPRWRIIEQS